jgi:hypothetical protein
MRRYSPEWDLTTIPDPALKSEWGRRNSHPPDLLPCAYCGQSETKNHDCQTQIGTGYFRVSNDLPGGPDDRLEGYSVDLGRPADRDRARVAAALLNEELPPVLRLLLAKLRLAGS